MLCPDLIAPFGGVMKLYGLVDTLNANGIESFIVHDDKTLQINWFDHSTRVTDFKSVEVKEDDLLIYPEVYGDKILNDYPGIKKIIFNQNSFYTLIPFNWNIDLAKKVYSHRDLVQVMVVSQNDFDFMHWLFPTVDLYKITLGIDPFLFHCTTDKKKQIAVMPRKLVEDYNLLIQLLLLKGALEEYTIKIIDHVSLEECAKILRESEIFISFSNQESFGLPPAEAMACGCVVIGYHGQGGKEYFKEDLTFPIEQSDIVSYAKCIEKVIQQFRTDPLKMKQLAKSGSEFILEKYSLINQEKSILEVIRRFI